MVFTRPIGILVLHIRETKSVYPVLCHRAALLNILFHSTISVVKKSRILRKIQNNWEKISTKSVLSDTNLRSAGEKEQKWQFIKFS